MKAKEHDKWRKSFPYFKVQWWNKVDISWHDIQKRFTSIQESEAHIAGLPKSKTYRIMQIERNGRFVL
jgi:hypothetical protein